jgi:hypothetical protein
MSAWLSYTQRSRPVAVILRPGKTPSGIEVRAHLRRLVRHIRRRWPQTRITFRGDSHYACPEAMSWCEHNGIDYVFGVTGTKPLARKLADVADAVRTERAIAPVLVTVRVGAAREPSRGTDRPQGKPPRGRGAPERAGRAIVHAPLRLRRRDQPPPPLI